MTANKSLKYPNRFLLCIKRKALKRVPNIDLKVDTNLNLGMKGRKSKLKKFAKGKTSLLVKIGDSKHAQVMEVSTGTP